MADYFFREDLEAEKDRQAQNPTLALNPAPQVQTMAAPAPQQRATSSPYAAIGAAATPAKPQGQENPFEAFRSALDAQDPLKAQTRTAISDTLANPAAAADEAAGLTRDRLAKSQQVEAERRRQQAGMAYGGAQTGQVGRAMDDFATEAMLQTQDVEGQLRAERAAAIERNRGAAIGQATQLIGQDQQAEIAGRQLSIQDRQLAENARQFNTRQEFEEAALREGYNQDAINRAWQSREAALERGSRETVAFAGLAQQDRALAQQAMQFNSQMEFNQSELAANLAEADRNRIWQAVEAEKARTSQERIAFAGLDLERDKFQAADANAKQGLSLEANAQAMARLGMDRDEAFRYVGLAQAKMLAERGLSLEESAQELTRQGMDQEDARYYAGLAQQDRLAGQEIASREKVAFAQIGSQERLQATQQVFQAEQAKLDRALEQLLSNDRIQAQFQLADLDRTFQERMQTAGFIQEREIETMRADLQTRLQERGISADAAKQIADQKFAELMAGRDQAFEERMTGIKQAWATGERISSQDWEGAMRSGEMQHQELMAKLESTLRLGEAQNAQAFQTAFQQMQNDFTLFRDQQGYSHEDAVRLATEAFQERMQQNGFSQDAAMQGAQLAWQANENQQNRASQEMMAATQLAQQDSQFMAELQQRYQFRSEDLDFRRQELEAQLEIMGLQGDQLRAALTNDKIQNAMGIAALGMEIGDGSEAAMAPFVEQLGAALEGYMKEQGIDISQSDFITAMKTTGGTGAPGATGPTPGSADALQSAQDLLDDSLGNLPASVDRTQAAAVLDAVAKGTYERKHLHEIKNQGLYLNYDRNGLPIVTPQAKDYLGFHNLVKMGIPEKDAAAMLIAAIGDQRFKASYKALTGKDWV